MTKDEILESLDHDTEMLDYGEVCKGMDIFAKQECLAMLKYLADERGYFDSRVACDTDEDLENILKEFMEYKK